MIVKRKLQLNKRNKQNPNDCLTNDCEVSKASIELMLYRVCNGNKMDFPFSN